MNDDFKGCFNCADGWGAYHQTKQSDGNLCELMLEDGKFSAMTEAEKILQRFEGVILDGTGCLLLPLWRMHMPMQTKLCWVWIGFIMIRVRFL